MRNPGITLELQQAVSSIQSAKASRVEYQSGSRAALSPDMTLAKALLTLLAGSSFSCFLVGPFRESGLPREISQQKLWRGQARHSILIVKDLHRDGFGNCYSPSSFSLPPKEASKRKSLRGYWLTARRVAQQRRRTNSWTWSTRLAGDAPTEWRRDFDGLLCLCRPECRHQFLGSRDRT